MTKCIAEAYVAGSFMSNRSKAYGVGVYYKSTNNTSHAEISLKRIFSDVEAAELKHVAGEIEAAKLAVELFKMEDPIPEKLMLYYKSEGIGAWAEDVWEPRKPKEIEYASHMQKMMRTIDIEFRKVNCRTDVKGYEIAETLAKKALLPSWHVISEYYKDDEYTLNIISIEESYESARKDMLAAAKGKMEMESGEEWAEEKFLDVLITRETPDNFPFYVQAGCFGYSGTDNMDCILFRNKEYPSERSIFRVSPY